MSNVKFLEYDFAVKVEEEDIANFIYLSYQQELIMWEWFPVGHSNFEVKNLKLAI